MTKQNIIYLVVGVLILLIASAFYWFQLRPSLIKKECWSGIEKIKSGELKIVNDGKFGQDDEDQLAVKYGGQKAIDEVYNNCLRKNGL